MAVLITDLCSDLRAETAALVEHVESLGDAEAVWDVATPAEGWTVRDQIVHLAFFDEAVTVALTDPDRFRSELVAPGGRSLAAHVAAAGSSRTRSEIAAWFEDARTTMIDAFAHADSTMRVPWYGPEMSVASALTARIMETWAHGQDVFDASEAAHPATSALRQVTHIGVSALPNSFVARGLEVPNVPVRLELSGPDGADWVWGPEDAVDRVVGPAQDFCLVVTQRRHVEDTDVRTQGAIATEWMSIAQAFAGPPGAGRRPGQLRPA